MERILHSISEEPFDFTYLGIGSAPHITSSESLDPKYDQLVPSCFSDKIKDSQKTFRLLHFDPWFDHCEGFLDSYFGNLGLIRIDFEGGYRWINNHIDVIVIPSSISHQDHLWFFQRLVNSILNTKGTLLIQEYTGYELSDLRKNLYATTALREKFKRRILVDMTYGTDIGCCTDMTIAQPFYDYDGNFLNVALFSEEETKRWIGVSLKLDTILCKIYTFRFLSDLNSIHVDYRRRLKGDTTMYGSSEYTDITSADTIMQVLQRRLLKSFDILLTTNIVGKREQETLHSLFQTYKNDDPYKWYDKVYKLIPRP
jgi:hypothetical protein